MDLELAAIQIKIDALCNKMVELEEMICLIEKYQAALLARIWELEQAVF